jgi:hypothetical protein
MFTPTVAKPSALAINDEGCGLSGSATEYPEYSTSVGNGPSASDRPSGGRTIAARSVPSRVSM